MAQHRSVDPGHPALLEGGARLLTNPSGKDYRPYFFGHCDWYQSLEKPTDPDEESAWYVAKAHQAEWFVLALNAGLAFARDHGLEACYSRRFAGISPRDLTPKRARQKGGTVSSPIWEIANELVVARYLERALGWELLEHEPTGRGTRKGDWDFRSQTGETVFVEVKSIREAEWPAGKVYTLPDYSPRIRTLLARAYSQLPHDHRSTLVVLVSTNILAIPADIQYSSLFEALFGKTQITFNVMPYDPDSVRIGPSFREMFTHSGKHRHMGCAAAFVRRGGYIPNLRFYVIHNPFAFPEAKLCPADFPGTFQFHVDERGFGNVTNGESDEAMWRKMQ